MIVDMHIFFHPNFDNALHSSFNHRQSLTKFVLRFTSTISQLKFFFSRMHIKKNQSQCSWNHTSPFFADLQNYTPTRREGAILQSPCPSVHTFVTDISASTGRNDFIFDIWLWHGDLYRVSPFQVYRTSSSCLPCDLQMNEWGYS